MFRLFFSNCKMLINSPRLTLIASLTRLICVLYMSMRRALRLSPFMAEEHPWALQGKAVVFKAGRGAWRRLLIFTPSSSAAAVISASTNDFCRFRVITSSFLPAMVGLNMCLCSMSTISTGVKAFSPF